MLTRAQARIHATKCGFVLDGIDAIPLHQVMSRSKSGKGAWPATDIIHPETQDVVHPAGYWIAEEDIRTFESIGLDYLILQD